MFRTSVTKFDLSMFVKAPIVCSASKEELKPKYNLPRKLIRVLFYHVQSGTVFSILKLLCLVEQGGKMYRIICVYLQSITLMCSLLKPAQTFLFE